MKGIDQRLPTWEVKQILLKNLKKQLQNFVCHLYGYEGYSIRFEIFKSGKYDEELLPRNQNSIDQHMQISSVSFGAMQRKLR